MSGRIGTYMYNGVGGFELFEDDIEFFMFIEFLFVLQKLKNYFE